MATTDPTLVVRQAPVSESTERVVGRTLWELFWLRFRKDKAAMLGLYFVVALVVLALVAPLISRFLVHHGPNDLFQQEMTTDIGIPKGPNGKFWFGADQVGRDIFIRVLYGARTSLIVAFFSTAIAMALGVMLGMIAGFFRGPIDTVISRFVDIVLSMPLLVFAIGISAACSGISGKGCLGGIVKPGLPLVIFIIAVFAWTYPARIIRGQTLSVREREFVEAARASGAPTRRILVREVLPNLVAPIVIYSTILIPSNILFEAYLSYLGLGIPDSVAPTWGNMISGAQQVYQVAWWTMLFPGLFLLFTTLAFNLLGDGLRDALDPRTERA